MTHDTEHDMTFIRVSTCLPAWRVDDDDTTHQMVVWVHFEPADPLLVRIHVGVVSLEAPRAVVAAGMTGPAECEELLVQLSPCEGFQLWTLRWTPEGPVTIRVPRQGVQSFLDATHLLVPDGEVDWDAAAKALVEEASEGDVP